MITFCAVLTQVLNNVSVRELPYEIVTAHAQYFTRVSPEAEESQESGKRSWCEYFMSLKRSSGVQQKALSGSFIDENSKPEQHVSV